MEPPKRDSVSLQVKSPSSVTVETQQSQPAMVLPPPLSARKNTFISAHQYNSSAELILEVVESSRIVPQNLPLELWGKLFVLKDTPNSIWEVLHVIRVRIV